MNVSRLVRFSFGLVAVTIPLVAFLLAQIPPGQGGVAEAAVALLPQQEYELGVSLQITSTSTATNTPTPTATGTASPTGSPSASPTASLTPSRTPASTPLYVDQYEPNNSFQEAYSTSAGLVLPLNTLWPAGDIDFFRFHAKGGSAYEVLTRDLDAGIDTFLRVYDSNGREIASNDDGSPLSRASLVTFSAPSSGFYYASVTNLDPSDPANKTYSFEVKEVVGTATPTSVASVDDCEPNDTFQSACLILLDTTYNFDFVPVIPGGGRDNDFFRVWVKAGLHYECETLNLSSVNDTNMILYYGPGEEFGIDGNDDKDRLGGDLGSMVGFTANYTGWLYVLVGPGPNMEPDYTQSHLYTYSLECRQPVATPTPTPTNTTAPPPPSTGGNNGGGGQVASPTPFNFPPTPTAFEFPTLAPPTQPPNVEINPLPTRTPEAAPIQEITVDVTIYYDVNMDAMPDATEGIMDVAVILYDNGTGQLLSFGTTNEAGNVRFGPISASNPIRVSVPYLNYSEVISESTTIQLRVVPRPLPGEIP